MGKRIAAVVGVYLLITTAWLILGGAMSVRSMDLSRKLSPQVAGLWGNRQVQQAPELEFGWWTTKIETEEVTDPATKKTKVVTRTRKVLERKPVILEKSAVNVALDLAHRQKGLLWYSTYQVDFAGEYAYRQTEDRDGFLFVTYRFPTTQASYDDFRFQLPGHPDRQPREVSGGDGKALQYSVPVARGEQIDFVLAYRSRGLDFWRYSFGSSVDQVRNFTLTMNTNFTDIDFPEGTISPNTKKRTDDGWTLSWTFNNLISGFDIGMDMPAKLNPGPLAAQISFFAPLSLLFFFLWLFVITLLRRVELHPLNYLFLGAAFFAFHLLFAYTVDHLALIPAFLLSSAVSVFLVVSYLRLVLGLRFAALEAGGAQVLYLVLFSYAHFYEGWTGLIVTCGSIGTLFVLMQLTGRINWSEKFGPAKIPTAERL
ncbi:MAG TPA: inner membrane CreD family protein [bacterium]|nr:inner membrane CreD family protein [bacterium]